MEPWNLNLNLPQILRHKLYLRFLLQWHGVHITLKHFIKFELYSMIDKLSFMLLDRRILKGIALIIPVRVDQNSIEALKLTLEMLSKADSDFHKFNKQGGLSSAPKVIAIANRNHPSHHALSIITSVCKVSPACFAALAILPSQLCASLQAI